jgi:hypothetical protein
VRQAGTKVRDLLCSMSSWSLYSYSRKERFSSSVMTLQFESASIMPIFRFFSRRSSISSSKESPRDSTDRSFYSDIINFKIIQITFQLMTTQPTTPTKNHSETQPEAKVDLKVEPGAESRQPETKADAPPAKPA